MSSETAQEAAVASTFNTDNPEVLVTTMLDVPGSSQAWRPRGLCRLSRAGYEILEIYGTIFGITVRSRNVFANIGAIMKTIVGGELKALTKNIETSRVSAVERLVAHAAETRANAVIAMRFDTTAGGTDGIAVTVYSTACKIRKINYDM